MTRARALVLALVGLTLAGLVAGWVLLGSATVAKDTSFTIPAGASVASVADKLEHEGLISSAAGFVLQARIFGADTPIQAGEFLLTPNMTQGDILSAFHQTMARGPDPARDVSSSCPLMVLDFA